VTHSTAWIRDDRFTWVAPVIGCLMLILMTVPKDLVSLVADPPSPGASTLGTYINSLMWLFVFGAAGLMALWRMRLALLTVREVNIGFLLFCALILASTLWSADPGVTLERVRRVYTVSGCCLAAMLVGWHRKRFQDVVRPGVTILLVASLFEGLLFPTIGIHDPSIAELKNSWRGVTGQKNILGGLATYGMILWYHSWLERDSAKWKIVLGMAVSFACLALSRSSTSLLTTVFSLFFMTLALRSPANLRRYTPYFVGIFSILVALYACAALGVIPGLQRLLDPITALTGKDAHTATGRAPIWALVKAEIARHPYFGIGYGAYWTGPIPGTASYIFVTAIYFYAYSAHNGYLEVTNDLGFAGLAVLLGYVLVYVKQSLRLWKIDRSQAALFLALLFQQGLENLSEAEWLQVTTVNFLVMTLATCALARALLDDKLRHVYASPAAATVNSSAGVRTGARARA
jgi:O-antigen ligase